MSPIPLRDHLAIRLDDFRREGTRDAADQFQAITRAQSAKGMLSSGNTVIMLERALTTIFGQVLDRGAAFIAEAAEDPATYVDLLMPVSWSFQADLFRAYEKALGSMGGRDAALSFAVREAELAPLLATARDRLIGDFKIGLVGGRRMTTSKNQNIANFQGAIINAPLSLSQSISKTGLDQEVLKFLAQLLGAADLAELPPEAKDAAEAVQDELAKPTPNKGKIARWLGSIGKFAAQVGKDAVAAGAKELAKQYAEQAGQLLSGG